MLRFEPQQTRDLLKEVQEHLDQLKSNQPTRHLPPELCSVMEEVRAQHEISSESSPSKEDKILALNALIKKLTDHLAIVSNSPLPSTDISSRLPAVPTNSSSHPAVSENASSSQPSAKSSKLNIVGLVFSGLIGAALLQGLTVLVLFASFTNLAVSLALPNFVQALILVGSALIGFTVAAGIFYGCSKDNEDPKNKNLDSLKAPLIPGTGNNGSDNHLSLQNNNPKLSAHTVIGAPSAPDLDFEALFSSSSSSSGTVVVPESKQPTRRNSNINPILQQGSFADQAKAVQLKPVVRASVTLSSNENTAPSQVQATTFAQRLNQFESNSKQNTKAKSVTAGKTPLK